MRVVKIGRTHLMDATPLTLGQEISGYVAQRIHGIGTIENSYLIYLNWHLAYTAVGTELIHPWIMEQMWQPISPNWQDSFVTAPNKFEALFAHDAVRISRSAQDGCFAVWMKIANDIRLLASGPRCGIGEIFYSG